MFLLLGSTGSLFSQEYKKPQLLRPLTEADRKALLDEASMLVFPEVSVNYTVNSADLYRERPATDTVWPSTQETIEKLKRKLEGKPADAYIYNEIGMICKRLKMMNDADGYFKAAVGLMKKQIDVHPDSANLYTELGIIYMNTDNFPGITENFEKALSLNPRDTLALTMLPIIYAGKGDYGRAKQEAARNIERWDWYSNYFTLALINMYEKMSHSISTGEYDVYRTAHIDSVFDYSRVIEAYRKKQGDFEFELLYNTMRIFAIFLRNGMALLAGETTVREFPLTREEMSELQRLEKFFTKSFSQKGFSNTFILHKSLGMIYVLKKEYKKALLSFTRAVEVKPISVCSFTDNTAVDYDNIEATLLLMGDSVSAENQLQKKINDRPAIDPIASDYAKMAMYKIWRRNYRQVREWCDSTWKYDPRNAEATECLAISLLVEGDLKKAEEQLNKSFGQTNGGYVSSALMGILLMLKNDTGTAHYIFTELKKTSPRAELPDRILKKYFVN